MASPTVAANAYAALSRIVESGGAEKAGASAGAGGPSFSALLKDAVGSVLDAGKKPTRLVLVESVIGLEDVIEGCRG